MSYESIPLVLYGLGVTLLIAVAIVNRSDQSIEAGGSQPS